MKNVFRLASAFAAGALAMYYLDPNAGRRRRAVVRDRGVAAGHDAGDFARGKARHTRDHMKGFMARARERLSRAPVDDDQLHERIRSRLGRLVGHPGEVHVEVYQGQVVLRGTASGEEIEELLDAVASMRGVEAIDNRLAAGSGSAVSHH